MREIAFNFIVERDFSCYWGMGKVKGNQMTGQPNWRIEPNPDDPGNFTRVDLPPVEPPVGLEARDGFVKKPIENPPADQDNQPPLSEEE